MFEIIFYQTSDGHCEFWDYLEDMRISSATNKDSRIQYNQILLYIQLLEENGLHLPTNILKHIENDIWELRPGKNRILLFNLGDTFLLLHHFRKTSQKTPKAEILKAHKEIADYSKRKDVQI